MKGIKAAADPGGQRGLVPLSLLKLVIRKMAAIRGALYFMSLAPPLLTILDPMLTKVKIARSNKSQVGHLLPGVTYFRIQVLIRPKY